MHINQTHFFPNFTNIALTTVCNETWLNQTIKNLYLEQIAQKTNLNNIVSSFCFKPSEQPLIKNETYMGTIFNIFLVIGVMPLLQFQLLNNFFPNR